MVHDVVDNRIRSGFDAQGPVALGACMAERALAVEQRGRHDCSTDHEKGLHQLCEKGALERRPLEKKRAAYDTYLPNSLVHDAKRTRG